MTLPRGCVAGLALLLTNLLSAPPLPAQEWRLNGLNSRVSELYQQGKYAEAVPIAEEAVKVAEATFGHDDPRLSRALDNLAALLHRQGRDGEAAPLLERALSIMEKALGPDDPAVITTLNHVAGLYVVQGNYAGAEPLYQRVLAADEKVLGPDHPKVATTLNNLASLYEKEGQYTKAEPLCQRALSIDEKALGPDHFEVATDLNNLALLFEEQGRYAEAEPFLRRALSIQEKASGPDDPEVAKVLSNLADLSNYQGRYAEAEPLYQRALSIDEKALRPDHPEVATDLNNLAVLYLEESRYAEAEALFQRALRIDEKALGADHPEVATDLNNLALLYYRQGKYAEAEPLYRQALSIHGKALGHDRPEVANDLNNLALLYLNQNKYTEAEPLLQRALRIVEAALGPEHPDVATSLNSLAGLYEGQGKYAEAEPLVQRALRIDEKALGADHPEVATDLDNLALLDVRQGEYAEAEPLYRRSLRIREKALGPDHPDLANSLYNFAGLYDDQGKYADAEPLFERAFDNLFQQFQYNFTYMTEKERLGFLDTETGIFPCYFSFVHRFHGKDPQLTGSMYNLLLWEKGLIAASVADMRRAAEASGDTEALKLLDALSQKRTQIAAMLNAKPPDRDLWRKQIDQLKTEANDIEKALVVRSSAFAEKKKLDQATWQQVRDALQPGEAAVEFARFRYYDKKFTDTTYYVALVVTRETKDQPEYIFLGDAKKVQGDALTGFEHSVWERGLSVEPETKLPGSEAYELIWKPLEKALRRKKRIYLSPDGILNEIPLGIIPVPDGKLLMEEYDLRLLSSTKDILRAAPPHAAATALLVGDPVFDLDEEQQRAAIKKLALQQPEVPVQMAALSSNAPLSNRVSRDQGNGSTLPPLPGTGAEVNAIAQLMQEHQWKTSVYTEELALKHVVEEASSPRVVHLATHGFFLPDQRIKTDRMGPGETQPSGLEDPMLRSGLYFAGADRALAGKPTAEGLDNGVLTAMEAGSLNLRGTELVVLSACNTGQGDVRNGEGVFGLRRALEEAGAQSVLMSLWSVPDQETRDLMKRFYTKWLAGMEIHEALKEAQLEIREQVKMTHGGQDLPYYWGAFVLVGR